jgi:class 3 adenylate cyclase/pimeloyl-ACP methyl ester carboxylesterase
VGYVPQTRYAKSGTVHIAYQVWGEGPGDLLFVPGFVSHLEYAWQEPTVARFLDRLGSFARVIAFDKRGTGLSDRVDVSGIERRMDDVCAVLDAAGSERAAVFGISEGGALSAVFAATYPDRTSALALYGSWARLLEADDYPFGLPLETLEAFADHVETHWGTGVALAAWAPSARDDVRLRRWWAEFQRLAASPGAAVAFIRRYAEVDARDVLPAISVPTLVIHRMGDIMVTAPHGRYLADHIPGARYLELPGQDHLPFVGDQDAILDPVEEFVTGGLSVTTPDRVLATVLFTDIVGSTERASELGDRRWRDLLETWQTQVRKLIDRYRGREINTTGDGFLATFDGPERAIHCATAVAQQSPSLGIDVRTGVHTGQCEVLGDDLGGIAVHIAARVVAAARPGEVLVSSTVKDLVAGSGIAFDDRGVHTLKGVPDEWRLFAVIAPERQLMDRAANR